MDKIICVGKNYSEHVQELARLIGDSVPEKPVLFLKPPSVLKSVQAGGSIELRLPDDPGSVHHECEIVLRLRSGGYKMTLDQARASIEAVTLGLDMTLRDVQSRIKKSGGPWEISKVFPASAVIGPWLRLSQFPDYAKTDFSFSIDGSIRQKGQASQMTLSPEECVAYASEFFELCAGDLIFTGTPAGVGPVLKGNQAQLNWSEHLHYQVNWI